MYFSITFISGIVGSLCRNYIPVNDLEGSLQIRCTFAPAARVGKWSALPNNTDTSLTFNQIEFHANMIRLSDSVLSMVKADNYTIYTENYSNFRQTVANTATSVEQLIPTRYSSLKSAYVVQRNAATSLNAAYILNPNTRDTLGIADYCFRLGSEMIPPSRIKGTAYGYVEPFEALKLSFHSGGNTIQSLGILNFSSYSASGITDLSGLFVIRQDF